MLKNLFTGSIWILLVVACCALGTLFGVGTAFAEPTGAVGLSDFILPMIGVAGVIDMFETRQMLDVVRQMKPSSQFLLNLFFPMVDYGLAEKVDVDYVNDSRRVAPFVSPIQNGVAVVREGENTNTIQPPYMKPKRQIKYADLLKRLAGGTINTVEQAQLIARLEELQARDLADLDETINRAMAWMAAQACQDGKINVPIIGDTETKPFQIDFGMDPAHLVSLIGTDVWTDAASDPYQNLADWSRLNNKDSGLQATDVVMDPFAGDAFIKNPSVLANKLNVRNLDLGVIKPEELPEGVTYLGDIIHPGINARAWILDDWYLNPTTLVNTAMLDRGRVIVGNRNAQNKQLYGLIQDVEALLQGIVAERVFPKSWTEKEAGTMWAMLQSAAFPALNQPDAFTSATVLAPL